jgi:Tfp pilus assembly protein PilX
MRASDDHGFALVSAILILVVLIGLGLGLLMFTDTQQHSATGEQSRESAYSLAEAALNAQIFQLSQNWPTVAMAPANRPERCTESTSTSTNFCPDPGTLGTSAGYPAAGSCSGTEAWGSSLSSRWTTYVRADGGGTEALFNSAVDRLQPPYENGDRSVWVRAVGVANCRPAVVVSKVSEQLVPMTFPRSVLSANGFSTSNTGKKVIIDTSGAYAQPPSIRPGPSAQPGTISVRCEGLTSAQCKNYRTGQVSPDTTGAPAGSSPTLNATQLEGLKAQAKANGTYYGVVNGSPTCPTTMAALTGAPTYVEGPCNLSFGGGTGNSSASPGFLVIANGTLSLGGNATFYGVVYAVNQQGSSGEVVVVHGNATLQGAINVDGRGTVGLGSSSTNLIYDPRAFAAIKGYSGAAPTPNTFRVLPVGQ